MNHKISLLSVFVIPLPPSFQVRLERLLQIQKEQTEHYCEVFGAHFYNFFVFFHMHEAIYSNLA